MPQKAIVIGAGLGGIAAALRLRARGYAVTLIDKQDKLGGRAYVYHRNGYTFDAGPTVVTAHFLFDELFALFGKKREDYITFVPVYPWYRIQFADRTTFDYGGTLEQTLAEINKIDPTGHDADGYLKLLAHTKKIYDVGFTQLGDKPFDTVWSMVKCAPALMRLGNWRTVWQMACKYLKTDKLRRVFSFQPLLVGGNPFNTTSIYSLIQYLEREWGVHFAMGGTGAIIEGLRKLMEEEGIEIRLGEEARQIEIHPTRDELTKMFADARVQGVKLRIEGRKITGVRLRDDTVIGGPVVVCNADAPAVYKHLIAPEFRPKWPDRKLDKLKYSMGLFVLYFGTTKQYPDIAHHTIILGDKYGELLKEMFDDRSLELSDLSVYLHRPTATDPSMAPAGCDCFYVLVPVPNIQPTKNGKTPRMVIHGESGTTETVEVPFTKDGVVDWAKFGDAYRDIVVEYLERTHLPGLKDCIVEDFFVTPEHFRDNLNTMHGTGFSIQPTFDQSAYFRFHNKSDDIEGLYFVGAGTHPGAGMPGVLCSAKVLERVLPEQA